MSWLSRLLLLAVAVLSGVLLSSIYSGNDIKSVLSQNHLTFLHLVAVSTSVGVQLWTTFVFGIVAFKNLPRRTFGTLQARLFPAYFQLVTVCSGASLYCFYCLKGGLAADQFQLRVLLTALFAVLTNLAFLEPKTSEVMFQRHRVEDQHPGASMQDLKSTVPEYKKLSAQFGMLHGMSSLVNLVALSATMLHLWYLSTRLSL